MGKNLPIAVVIGVHPFITLAAATSLPFGKDELELAGALFKEPLEVMDCETSDLQVPAYAEIILEGEIELDPAKFRTEGPLGEYVGFYAASGWGEPKPWFQVKRILRRKNPIFVATTVGRPVGDTHIANTIGRTAYLWADLEMMKVPGIQSVYCPPEATGRFWAIVSVKSTYPAQGERVAEAVCASPTGHFGVKGVIVVDADVPADDLAGVWWSLAVRYNPIEDTQIIKKMRATPFDPALPVGNKAIGSRILIDATTPVEWEKKPLLVELDEDTTKKVVGKWQEYGFENPY